MFSNILEVFKGLVCLDFLSIIFMLSNSWFLHFSFFWVSAIFQNQFSFSLKVWNWIVTLIWVWYWYANIARWLLIGHHCIWVEQSFLYTKWMMGKTCHCRTTSHCTKKCLTELLHYYQGKWSKRKQWLAWQLSSNFSLLLSLICTHMGGKGICVNEASQKIAKYSSSLCSDLKTVAHSCKHAIIHVSSACNPMKRRRFPKQNEK